MKNLIRNLKSKKVKRFIKKWDLKTHPIAISAVAFLLITVGCHERKDAPPCGTKKRQSCQPLSLKAVSEQNVHGCWQGKSAPYLNSGGFSIEGDFIYWRVDEDGLDYVMTTNTSDSSTDSKLHKPDISWDPGFKIGMGYTWGDQDFWDLFLRWTHLNSKQSGEKKAPNTTGSHVLLPVWSPTVLDQLATTASAHWQVRYNTLDLEMGRNYFISKTVALRPYVGIRSALILQHYEARYHGVITPLAPDPHTHMKAQNNFKGLGARAGAQFKWHFVSDWSVVGSVSGSLLCGWYNINQKLAGVETLAPMNFGLKDNFTKVATNLEASLGFEWECFFSDDDYRVAISLAYEFSEWFSQNRMKQFNLVDNAGNMQVGVTTVGAQNGDLGLQGATLQVRFDF